MRVPSCYIPLKLHQPHMGCHESVRSSSSAPLADDMHTKSPNNERGMQLQLESAEKPTGFLKRCDEIWNVVSEESVKVWQCFRDVCIRRQQHLSCQ